MYMRVIASKQVSPKKVLSCLNTKEYKGEERTVCPLFIVKINKWIYLLKVFDGYNSNALFPIHFNSNRIIKMNMIDISRFFS